ncbi:RNA polymerase factor sigma-54 [Mangrovicoccus ximenensis]|uniref:RNA polymerase factor sigma-54 n=1 Tax=Mangrovicoccus ximenensis TaxID=1911570 RepID=UPI000D356049|nr:hypothetical protein [Mangrovicoccus ximenensis]
MQLSQGLFQRQTQTMSAQMLASLSILGMSNQDLAEHLAKRAESNPAIQFRPPRIYASGGEEFDRVAALASDKPSLAAHVMAQIDLAFGPGNDRQIALSFAEALEPTGWLGQTVEAVADRNHVPVARAERVLADLQGLEPVGIFARSLGECLKLQARDADMLTWELEVLLDNLGLLAEGRTAELADLCDCEPSDIPDIARTLRRFDPKPGLAFSHDRTPIFPPDLTATRGAAGWTVALTRSTLPSITVVPDNLPAETRDRDAKAFRRRAPLGLATPEGAAAAAAATLIRVDDVPVPQLRIDEVATEIALSDAEAAGTVFLAPDAVFSAVSSAGLAGGAVTVSYRFPSDDYGNRPYGYRDRIAVNDEGGGAGQIGIAGDGTTVTFGGAAFAAIAGDGAFGRDFRIELAAGADVAAVQALLRNLTWSSEGDTEGGRPDLTIRVSDGGGVTGSTGRIAIAIDAEQEAPDPAGPEIHINAYTSGEQSGARLAQLSNGNLVAVWNSLGQDNPGSNDWGVFGRLFDPEGNAISGEFQVNEFRQGSAVVQDVVALADGRFAVGYEDGNLQLRTFAADGSAEGGQVQVEQYAYSTRDQLELAALQDGGVFAAWRSWNADGNGYGIAGRVFGGTGQPAGDEFVLNAETASYQEQPHLATLADGNVVAVWFSQTSGTAAGDGDGHSIQMRMFAPDGTDLSATETTVNSHVAGNQYEPSVAVLAGGNIVVAWRSDAGNGSGAGIHAVILTPAGAVVAEEFLVNDFDYSTEYAPVVTALSGGGFVIGWNSNYRSDSYYDVILKTYAADGSATSDEFRAHGAAGSHQYLWDIAALGNDAFAVSWREEGSGNPAGDGSNDATGFRIFGDPSGAGRSAAPQIAGLGDAAFTEAQVNAGPQALFAALDLADPDSAAFEGGLLVVSAVEAVGNLAGFGPEDDGRQDNFSILARGGIALSGSDVLHGAAVIGTVESDGQDGRVLRIALGAGAGRAAVEALAGRCRPPWRCR